MILFAAHDTAIQWRNLNDEGPLLLRAIREYTIADMYLSFEVHSDTTLRCARQAQVDFGEAMEVCHSFSVIGNPSDGLLSL